jgi:hypothetical protein
MLWLGHEWKEVDNSKWSSGAIRVYPGKVLGLNLNLLTVHGGSGWKVDNSGPGGNRPFVTFLTSFTCLRLN